MPTSGQLYRFAKTLVEGEDLFITYTYVRDWVRAVILLVLLAAAGFGVFRARRAVAAAWSAGADWLAAHEAWWAWVKTPAGVRILLAAGAVFFAFISTFLMAVFVLLFLMAWLKPHWIFRGAPGKSADKKAAVSASRR